MRVVRIFGWFSTCICVVFAIIFIWLLIHSSLHPQGNEDLINSNTLILRKAGVAIGSWRGRIAIGYMDNQRFKYWNFSSLPHNSNFFEGLLEYQAVDDGQASWDFDFDYPAKLSINRFGNAWQLAGFAFASHTVSHDLDDPITNQTIPISVHTVCFAIPDYLIILFFIVYPIIRIQRKRITAYRLKSGLCIKCGYNLNGGQNICPECGMPSIPIGPTSQIR